MRAIFNDQGVLTNERDSDKFIIPRKSLESSKNFITYDGIKTWNQIPKDIIKSKSLNSFTKKYKEYLLSKI